MLFRFFSFILHHQQQLDVAWNLAAAIPPQLEVALFPLSILQRSARSLSPSTYQTNAQIDGRRYTRPHPKGPGICCHSSRQTGDVILQLIQRGHRFNASHSTQPLSNSLISSFIDRHDDDAGLSPNLKTKSKFLHSFVERRLLSQRGTRTPLVGNNNRRPSTLDWSRTPKLLP